MLSIVTLGVKFTLVILTLVCSMSSIAKDDDRVDDLVVKKWIEAGILGKRCEHAANEADLTKLVTPSVLRVRWAHLKSCRDAGQSQNLNLAAAEWYLFIRYASSDTGDTFYRNLPNWYSTLKSLASALNLSELLKTSNEPVSKTNKQVTEWGERGVEDGLRDYELRTKKKPELKTEAFSTGFEFVKSKFYE